MSHKDIIIDIIGSYAILTACTFLPIVISLIIYKCSEEKTKRIEDICTCIFCFGAVFGIYWFIYTCFYILEFFKWINK